MKSFFRSASVTEIGASTTQLQALIQMFRQDLMTGLIEISYSTDDHLIFLFVEGRVATTYLVNNEIRKRLQPIEWNAILSHISGTFRTLQLPPDGLRVSKILIEACTSTRNFTAQSPDLKTHIEEWTAYPQPVLVHLRWLQAEAALFFPGQGQPAQPVLFIDKEQTISGAYALRKIIMWHETQFDVSVYSGEQTSEAFQENLLVRTFTGVLQKVIRRYNELAGRSLVNALGQEITNAARGQGWHIQSAGETIMDSEIFSTIQDQASAYRMLAGLCMACIEDVLGPKITNTILRETLTQLDKTSLQILQTYPFLAITESTGGGGKKP